MKLFRSLLGLLLTLTFFLIVPDTVSGQTEKLGPIAYTPVKGWKKTARENIVTFSEIDTAAGKFCTITLYGSTAGTGKAENDFVREWNNLVTKPFGAARPKTETEMIDGWTATGGGVAIDFNGTPAVAFLTVLTESGRTVSILGIFNDESYLTKLVAFNTSIDIDKPPVALAASPALETVAPHTAPAASSTMHAQLLVQEFERNEIRAGEKWIGKRVRVYGTVNSIAVATDKRLVITFKGSLGAYGNARCYFGQSQVSRVAQLSPNIEATVEGTVRGWEGGYSGAKVFLLLDDCVVP